MKPCVSQPPGFERISVPMHLHVDGSSLVCNLLSYSGETYQMQIEVCVCVCLMFSIVKGYFIPKRIHSKRSVLIFSIIPLKCALTNIQHFQHFSVFVVLSVLGFLVFFEYFIQRF